MYRATSSPVSVSTSKKLDFSRNIFQPVGRNIFQIILIPQNLPTKFTCFLCLQERFLWLLKSITIFKIQKQQTCTLKSTNENSHPQFVCTSSQHCKTFTEVFSTFQPLLLNWNQVCLVSSLSFFCSTLTVFNQNFGARPVKYLLVSQRIGCTVLNWGREKGNSKYLCVKSWEVLCYSDCIFSSCLVDFVR